MQSDTAIIRLRHASSCGIDSIKRVSGFMPARNIISLIDVLDLEANPRNSKMSSVTKDIQGSIESTPDLFPLMSKGILLAASNFEELERGRFKLQFEKRNVEGILDGGHNTLAIGSFILLQAFKAAGKTSPKQGDYAIWENFKKLWGENRELVDDYIDAIDNNPEKLIELGVSNLRFTVPVEILLPATNDYETISAFQNSLLDICTARNNNAQLAESTKANRAGLFESLRSILAEKNPTIAERISWKSNDGNSVDVRDLIALAWIPLSRTSLTSGNNPAAETPNPPTLYSGKATTLNRYIKLICDDRISTEGSGSVREIKNPEIISALKLACDMPALYDRIFEFFPDLYNEAGGKFGRISAVKGQTNGKDDYETPFGGKKVNTPVPKGFVYPLVWGLRSIIERDEETGCLKWAVNPYEFIESPAFREVVTKFSASFSQLNYDPQKVGKGKYNYTTVEDAVTLAKLKILAK